MTIGLRGIETSWQTLELFNKTLQSFVKHLNFIQNVEFNQQDK